ncbi:MAG: Na/Pi cotransporter family protein [Fusicatenibacter sp.]|nr:Na/Pi cotransporter family protein [Lachnospiraceae bacterium]MDY2938462.1 Na/Pi cotransporter family protein [Fusicatenibacter sp.]
MDIFGILTFIGGLAMFLYGMSSMGDGLTKLSGGKLEHLLEKLTSNRFMAVLLGAGVTAVIQSSSATTVMVVGFVNSGIMKLSQAVGIIMGANIGTTITSWILSLTGIESSNVFIKMLNPSSFSPILAIIGVFLLMMSKNDKTKNIGTLLTGFSILMFGMSTMSSAVSPLADVPEFTGILTKFSMPLLGVLAGAFLTAVIQSSSASIGILQALCATGSVSYAIAIPIIMGQNIGTCITALLSSIGTTRNAKRTAMVHLYFNVIGTLVFLILFYGITAFVSLPFLNQAANAAGIAIIHSGFNIFATIALLPFGNGLVRLAKLTIPDGPEEKADEACQMLDRRFLDSPAFALTQCKHAAATMADLTEQGLYKCISLLDNYNPQTAEEVATLESRVDHYEDALGTYLVQLSSKKLSRKDSQTLSMILHCIGDFERISDHTVNVMQAAKEMHEKSLHFSDGAAEELSIYGKAVEDIVTMSFQVFKEEDQSKSKQVEPLEQVIDGLNAQIKNNHIYRLQNGKCTIELGFILSDVMTDFERVSDHCSNIAACVSQVQNGGFDTHEYLRTMKSGADLQFEKEYRALSEKYQLPSRF